MEFFSKNYEETISFVKEYAKSLAGGDIVLLKGDLGAGKTVFAKGIVEYFCKDAINVVSPTFTIVNTYNGDKTINHFDFYRINSENELIAIGIEEYLYGDAICLIEWPERAPNILKDLNCKLVNITKKDDGRIISY